MVDGFDLIIECGMIYGFLGLNGSGKIIVICMLIGLLMLIEGSVEVFGLFVLKDVEVLKYKIGYMI